MKTIPCIALFVIVLFASSALSQVSCNDESNYAPLDAKYFTVKKIRIAFQVVTDYNFNGNIPNNSSGIDFSQPFHPYSFLLLTRLISGYFLISLNPPCA